MISNPPPTPPRAHTPPKKENIDSNLIRKLTPPQKPQRQHPPYTPSLEDRIYDVQETVRKIPEHISTGIASCGRYGAGVFVDMLFPPRRSRETFPAPSEEIVETEEDDLLSTPRFK